MIETERLLLRQWMTDDFEPFAELNRDPEVMRYFPHVQTQEESDAMAERCLAVIADRGWGFFALEQKATGFFIGFTGMQPPSFEADFTPCVEIGWRLAKQFWGHGYASEAAIACLTFAKEDLHFEEVVSFTSKHNLPSITVMERIGMTRDVKGDFNHPNLEPGHRLTAHVLYRIAL